MGQSAKTLFTREMFEKEGEDSGVFISSLGEALTTWAAMNYPETSVAAAMIAFNTTREVIIEAIGDAVWSFLSPAECDDASKQLIEVDGE